LKFPFARIDSLPPLTQVRCFFLLIWELAKTLRVISHTSVSAATFFFSSSFTFSSSSILICKFSE